MTEANQAGRRAAAARWARGRVASVAVALVGAVAGGSLYLGNQAYITATSPASCGAGCVTDGSVPLGPDPGMLDVERRIAKANSSAMSGGPYASVVLLDPLTYSTSGTVSQARMTDELRGAYLAQVAANSQQGATRIRLLLANEWTSGEEGEAQAVRQIVSLQGQDHIVAVAGMGLSTANTQTAATALTADGMPMFGALTTGDQFNGDNYQGFFYQVVPDVDAQVQKLRGDLKVTKGQHVALISSNQATDIYSTDLQTDFSTAFGSRAALRYYSFDPAAAGQPGQQLAIIATTICGQPGGSPVVLYAGREAALPTLVQQFQQAAVCDRKNVTIVTGSDANGLPASVTSAQRGIPGATVTVEYSDIEDVGSLSGGFTTGYSRWVPTGIDPRTACRNQLYDPWAAATYNSVMAAAGALRHFPGPPDKETVLRNAVELQASLPYAGVNGQFGFTAKGQLASADIPVYQDSNGTCSQVSAGA
jgi:ABC-type branched-subunit amino acid transport system substrate-binding protein